MKKILKTLALALCAAMIAAGALADNTETDSQLPPAPPSGEMNNGQQPPEPPDGNMNGQPPAPPSGDMNGQPPAKPDGENAPSGAPGGMPGGSGAPTEYAAAAA